MLSALAQRICALHGGAEPGTPLAPPGFASIRRQPARARVSARADASLTGLAEARARCLLRRVLDTNQRRQYEAYGCFAVQVADRSTFGILPRPFFNVMELRTGALYCCVIEGKVPLADLMLAQKLLLERDPDLFFSTANATGKGCTQDDRLRCLLTAWEAGRGDCNRDIA
jgi:hypothetical protein